MADFCGINSGVAALLPSMSMSVLGFEIKVIEKGFDGVVGVVPFFAPFWVV